MFFGEIQWRKRFTRYYVFPKKMSEIDSEEDFYSLETTKDDSSRFLVSGWEDDLDEIDTTRNVKGKLEKEFMTACEKGNFEKVKELLVNCHNLVNAKDMDGYTPLHRACYENHPAVVQFLIDNGADICAKTEMKWEPLHSCCQWNHAKCAAILIQAGANVNATSDGGQTPLHIAASHGTSYDTVQLLLMHPYIQPSLKNKNNEIALDIARRSSKFYNVFDMVDPVLDIKNLELIRKKRQA